ncbi:MAG: MarR family winged helix-turn-helix transcriptional regulator [Desulfobacteraceae bacterium]|nr:MarR family winged helix-turn-helix transcriptional regulator [Desulfobacteraceae bacterium]
MNGAGSKEGLTPWICRISRLSAVFVGREMTRLGFGPGQFFLLSELYAEDGISQDELSRRVAVDKSNTSRALSRLEAYGLIRRSGSPDNHKVKLIYLEPKALEIRKEFRRIQERWNEWLLDGISEKEQSKLLSQLKTMADNAAVAPPLDRSKPRSVRLRQVSVA